MTTPVPGAPCGWDVEPATCDAEWSTYSPEVQQFAITTASAVVWAATGRQFGECELTVRPCGKWDGNAWWGGWWWGFYASGWGWGPLLFNGFFPGCGCMANGWGWCECVPDNQIWLPGPVSTIVSVVENGSVVDPATYRVDDHMWLVRTSLSGGTVNTWPWQQNYNLDAGDSNTLTVTFTKGVPVPPALLYGTGLLASQYAKACASSDCQLPFRVQSIVRQNVSLHAVDPSEMMADGLTGITILDQLIKSYNPFGLKSPPAVYSPDSPVNRTTTWSSP